MTLLIELEASFAGTVLTLVNGSTTTGYSAKAGTNLGAPVEKPMYSRTLDSLGTRVTGATLDAREVQVPLLVEASTVAQLQTYIDSLLTTCRDITHQGGGVLRYRSKSGSYVTSYKVASAVVGDAGVMEDYEAFVRQYVTLALVVDPFGLADAYDVADGFTYDTFGTAGRFNRGGADWTAYTGALTNAAVTGGVLDAAANLSTLNTFAHTGTPHVYGDVEIQHKHTTGATVTAYVDGAMPVCVGTAGDGIRVYVDKATDTLRIDKVAAGVATNLANTAITAMAASTSYWAVARRENNTIYAEHWTSAPTPAGTPTVSTSYTLSTAEAALYGKTITTRVALLWKPIETSASIDDVQIRGNVYRLWTFPDVVPLNAAWGGTVDAQAGVYYTNQAGGTAPTTMLYAWWPKPPASNMVWNGGGEVIGNVTTTAYGWSAAAVTGVTGAATSVARGTTAANIRTGAAYLEAVCPATANTGVTNAIYRRFRKGVSYTVSAWHRAASGTTTARVRLGVSGDIASTTAVALSTTWTQHTTTWTPTADRDVAYFCSEITAATGTTYQIDDVMVYEGTTAPTFAPGGAGPGILDASSYDAAKASLSTDGTYWTLAADATYRLGFRVRGSGAMTTTANLEYFVDPRLFAPDDFTSGEVDVAVLARCEVASTQTSLACVISTAPEGGTTYGARKYSGFRSTGKTLKLPSSGTAFKPYYLGTVTLRVDRTNPVRWKLRLAFTNSGAASGNFGVDYIVLAPARSIASSRRGAADASVPDFIASTTQTTKLVQSDLRGMAFDPASVISAAGIPDDGLLGERIILPRAGAELLVWPLDQVIDLTDSSTASCAKSFTGTVQVAVQPQHHVLRQA